MQREFSADTGRQDAITVPALEFAPVGRQVARLLGVIQGLGRSDALGEEFFRALKVPQRKIQFRIDRFNPGAGLAVCGDPLAHPGRQRLDLRLRDYGLPVCQLHPDADALRPLPARRRRAA